MTSLLQSEHWWFQSVLFLENFIRTIEGSNEFRKGNYHIWHCCSSYQKFAVGKIAEREGKGRESAERVGCFLFSSFHRATSRLMELPVLS